MDDPFQAEKEMGDWPEVNLLILYVNGIRSCFAQLEQTLPSYCQRIGRIFLNMSEDMAARCSLKDKNFSCVVRLFSVANVNGILGSIFSEPFGTLVTISYIIRAIYHFGG